MSIPEAQSRWVNVKNQMIYTVLRADVYHSETGERMVLYERKDHCFVRPLSMWHQKFVPL